MTVLFVLLRLVPALIEQFLWKHNHAFSQDRLLCGYFLPISFDITFWRKFLPWWWVSALSQVKGFHSIGLDVFRSYWAISNFLLTFSMVFLYWPFKFLAEVLLMLYFFHIDQTNFQLKNIPVTEGFSFLGFPWLFIFQSTILNTFIIPFFHPYKIC